MSGLSPSPVPSSGRARETPRERSGYVSATGRAGLYYAQLDAADGRDRLRALRRPAGRCSAPRPGSPSFCRRNTWQAYNFYDADGDGWGDTWYAGGSDRPVPLDRPFLNRGVPPFSTATTMAS